MSLFVYAICCLCIEHAMRALIMDEKMSMNFFQCCEFKGPHLRRCKDPHVTQRDKLKPGIVGINNASAVPFQAHMVKLKILTDLHQRLE